MPSDRLKGWRLLPEARRIRFSLLVSSWLIIICVAGLDTYLTVKHSPIMHEVELNPLGRFVMKSDGGTPLFVGMKTAGLALALLFTFALWQKEALRSKVVVSSGLVAGLSVATMGMMFVDFDRLMIERELSQFHKNVTFADSVMRPRRERALMVAPAHQSAVAPAAVSQGRPADEMATSPLSVEVAIPEAVDTGIENTIVAERAEALSPATSVRQTATSQEMSAQTTL